MISPKRFRGGISDRAVQRRRSYCFWKPFISWCLLTILFLAISTSPARGDYSSRVYLPADITDGYAPKPLADPTTGPSCRFGIASVSGLDGYDLAPLRVGGYLDWNADSALNLPANVDYVRQLRLRDEYFIATKQVVETIVPLQKGQYWSIGNEPDTTFEKQDNLTAETYAERFFELANRIRVLDPDAKIGFGAVVQPTSIRMRYLDRAWNRLTALAGSAENASKLIDFWNIHAFILNENPAPGSWGTGVPKGFESDHADAMVITNFADTYSNVIFERNIRAFRTWMAGKGEREKPLWITEYGSLFPPIDPVGINLVNVNDTVTSTFMTNTFTYLLNATDPLRGLPSDQNRLVQRWFWYSLNGHRWEFGGTLYDPDNNKQITPVGIAFRDYVQSQALYPDIAITNIQVSRSFVNKTSPANYRLYVTIENRGSVDALNRELKIFDSSHNLLATFPIQKIRGCGETTRLALDMNGISQTVKGTLTAEISTLDDSNPINNYFDFSVDVDFQMTNVQTAPQGYDFVTKAMPTDVDARYQNQIRFELINHSSVIEDSGDLLIYKGAPGGVPIQTLHIDQVMNEVTVQVSPITISSPEDGFYTVVIDSSFDVNGGNNSRRFYVIYNHQQDIPLSSGMD